MLACAALLLVPAATGGGVPAHHRLHRLAARPPPLMSSPGDADATGGDDDDVAAFDRASVANAATLWKQREGRSQVFGAWLDDEIVNNRGDDSNDAFGLGIALLRRGRYTESRDAFALAIQEAGGEGTSKGGQMCVWLAQAMSAAGDNKGAVSMLDRVEQGHPNPQVRKAAGEIKYILAAPELQLDEDNFVQIPDKIREAERLDRHRGEYAQMEKPPERYSLEWYLMQNATTTSSDDGDKQAVAVAAATMAALVAWLGALAVSG